MTKKQDETNQEKGSGAKLVSRISVKLVSGDVRKLEPGFVMRIIGIATDTKAVTTQYGESIGLKGQFMAINPKGEQFMSGTAYLPNIALSLITGQLAADQVEGVKFAFDLFKVLDDSVMIGYRYEAKPLVEPAENNPLFDLAKTMPALPAPEKE